MGLSNSTKHRAQNGAYLASLPHYDARAKLEHLERLTLAQKARIAQLEAMALSDDLTGLLNRRGLTEFWHREHSAAARDKTGGGVLVMFDLDGFKAVNDRYGHSAGDACLQHVGLILRRNVRPTDVVARLSGDEFAVMFTRLTPAAGLARADTLAAKLNAATLDWERHRLDIRASHGAAPYGEGDTLEQILRSADALLYQRKAERSLGGRLGDLMMGLSRKVKAGA
jgi:diguanylate cyclase (GGDEF)-like protein